MNKARLPALGVSELVGIAFLVSSLQLSPANRLSLNHRVTHQDYTTYFPTSKPLLHMFLCLRWPSFLQWTHAHPRGQENFVHSLPAPLPHPDSQILPSCTSNPSPLCLGGGEGDGAEHVSVSTAGLGALQGQSPTLLHVCVCSDVHHSDWHLVEWMPSLCAFVPQACLALTAASPSWAPPRHSFLCY